jgi:ferredoxin--NADP+ reductase
VGGQSDRRLGIPGEDLAGSHSSTAFVAWYSGHPDFMDLEVDLSCERVAVVGIGNVAMDVARVLVRSPEELAATDIADEALEVLRQSRVKEVYILARRGPVQAACTPPELQELGELSGVDLALDPRDLELDAASAAALEEDRTAQKNLKALHGLAMRGDTGAERRLTFRFLESPLEILGEGGKVAGLKVERNRLVERSGGYLAAEGTGETEVLPVGMVIRAVGYRSVPLPGVPFDERKGLIPNREGRIQDLESGEILPRLYAVGWVKRGPTGLIGSNKPDAVETVERMLEDLPKESPIGEEQARPEAVDELLRQRGVRVVTYDDWLRLDAAEVRRGEEQGRPRVKLVRLEEMLAELAG